MTNEEKQALIDALGILKPEVAACPALAKAVEIAITALTAQPEAWLVEFQEPMTDDYCRSVKTVQIEKPTGHYLECATPLIRVASNEVQE